MRGRAWSRATGRRVLLVVGAWVSTLIAMVPGVAAQEVQLDDPRISLTGVRQALFSGLASQVGTLPNPTGGSFTFKFDPGLGVFARVTESLGTVFANRSETTGRGKFTLTASYSLHTFDEVDGVNLRNGQLKGIYFGVAPIIPGVLDDFLAQFTTIRQSVSAEVLSFGGIYGVTDRIDVGLLIPLLRVRVKERVLENGFIKCFGLPATGDLVGCGDFIPTNLEFRPNDVESTGLGDIILRGKYNFLELSDVMAGRMGVAAAVDVKLPTGDRGDRGKFNNPTATTNVFEDPSTQRFQIGDPPLGTGVVRVRPQLVASGSWFGFAPHANVGVELGKTQGITNDLVYEVGLDYTVLRRVTVSADVLGRHAFDVDRTRITKQNLLAQDVGKKANPDTITASFGIKVNPVGTLLVFLNFLVPLNETGFRDDLTPTFGLEWSF